MLLAGSLYIVSCVVISLAIVVLRANHRRQINRTFATFAIAIGVWSLGISVIFSDHAVSVGSTLSFAGASLIPATFLRFMAVYPAGIRWPHSFVIRTFCSLGLAFAFLAMATPYIIYDPVLTESGFQRKSGPAYLAFVAYFFACWACGAWQFVRQWRERHGHERIQLRSLAVAIAIPLAGAIATNIIVPVIYGTSAYTWLGPYFGLLLAVLITHGIIRHRFMDLRFVVDRSLTIAVAAGLSFVPVAILLAAVWPRLVESLEPVEVAVLLAGVVAVTVLVPLTRDCTERLLDRYVYRRRANYQRTVREASRALTRMLDLRRLLPFLRDTVIDATESEGVAIYVRRGPGLVKGLAESRVPYSHFQAPKELPTAVATALERTGDAVVADAGREAARDFQVPGIQAHLRAHQWAVVLPAIFDNAVIGAIVLGPKRSGDAFYPQDLDLLMTLANQAGIALKNAHLYAEALLANEHLENVVATIDSAVIATDAGGRLTMVNPAAERLTGMAVVSTGGQAVADLPPPLGGPLLDTLRDGQTRTYPEIELGNDGIARPVMCRTSALREPSGGILGAVLVFSDLTPVKALEVERRRAERLAFLEAIAGGIAHEVKQPLVAIKTYVQLIPRRRHDDDFIGTFGRVVEHEIVRMERLITRLRTLSSPGPRLLVTVDLRTPVLDALEFMQPSFEDKGLQVDVDLGPAPVLVSGDAGDLEGLFLNLLINAHQATPPEGRIEVRLIQRQEHVAIEVQDSGPGMAAEVLDRVFDPHFTTKHRGSGLGLAICMGIADAHQARIGAANAPDGGARFTVEFPLAALVPASVA